MTFDLALSSPAAQLSLLIVAALAFRRFAGPTPAPTAAGSIVMAIGIFELAALQQFRAARVLTQPLALALLVVWGVIAASFLGAYLRDTFDEHLASPVRAFAVGTWVAGTAVLARVVLLAIPEWRPLAALLGMLAAVLWIGFLALMVKSIPAVAARSRAALVPGVILLSTVSTQSLSLAGLDLLPAMPVWRSVAVGLIALGALFYLVCGALVVRSHSAVAGWTLKDDWDNSNCVIHGAMSITGLALVASGAAPPWLMLALWVYVLCAFVAIEAVEVARLAARIGAYGWLRGAFTYDVTQWSRNFTFGMFYAFTLALSKQPAAAVKARSLDIVMDAVLALGPYVVLLLLVIETALYLVERIGRRSTSWRMPPARRS